MQCREVTGLATYRIEGRACEIVTIDALVVAVREGAVDEARQMKPSIPLVGKNGVPITDEIELERPR
jgi:hypothetical protein